MKFYMLFLFCLLHFFGEGQIKVLFTGNYSSICYMNDSIELYSFPQLPKEISKYDAVFIFSTAHSILNKDDIEKLNQFLNQGKGIYIGAENWPLQAESNQLTSFFYSKEVWGNFTDKNAIPTKLGLIKIADSIPAGSSTVVFPLDYRLKVEAWINDEPLILSGKLVGGHVILDGGYSRFYCIDSKNTNQQLLSDFIRFLVIK